MEEKPPVDDTSLLGSIPPTDPAILKRMRESRAEEDHYAAIGRVATQWANLELEIDVKSIELANFGFREGTCLTAQISGSARKLDAYISLARLYDIPHHLVSDLCKLAQETGELSRKRNRYIHDTWEFNHPDEPSRFEITAQKILRLEEIPVSTKQLVDFACEIIRHRRAFHDLAATVKAEHDALRDKSSKDTHP